MGDLVSIIIPAYNCEPYLKKAVMSIKKQTYQNLDIIIIDDGSEDNTLTLARELQREYDKIRIMSQENYGVAHARNRGIKEALGVYIVFMDDDDYIEPDYIEVLLEEIKKKSADMIISGYKRVTEDGQIIDEMRLSDDGWSKFRNISPWGRIVKTDFIRKYGVSFEEFNIGEDTYFNISAYSQSNKIYTIDYTGYHWIYRPKSVSNTRQKDVNQSPIPMLEALIARDKKNGQLDKEIFGYFIVKFICWHLVFITMETDRKTWSKIFRSEKQWIKNNVPGYKQNIHIGLRKPAGELLSVRVAVVLFVKLPDTLFYILVKIYSAMQKIQKRIQLRKLKMKLMR